MRVAVFSIQLDVIANSSNVMLQVKTGEIWSFVVLAKGDSNLVEEFVWKYIIDVSRRVRWMMPAMNRLRSGSKSYSYNELGHIWMKCPHKDDGPKCFDCNEFDLAGLFTMHHTNQFCTLLCNFWQFFSW